MRHLVKPILLVLDSTVIVAGNMPLFSFIKRLNYIAHSAYYFYLLAYFVFIFLAIREINVTLFQTRNPSEPVLNRGMLLDIQLKPCTYSHSSATVRVGSESFQPGDVIRVRA